MGQALYKIRLVTPIGLPAAERLRRISILRARFGRNRRMLFGHNSNVESRARTRRLTLPQRTIVAPAPPSSIPPSIFGTGGCAPAHEYSFRPASPPTTHPPPDHTQALNLKVRLLDELNTAPSSRASQGARCHLALPQAISLHRQSRRAPRQAIASSSIEPINAKGRLSGQNGALLQGRVRTRPTSRRRRPKLTVRVDWRGAKFRVFAEPAPFEMPSEFDMPRLTVPSRRSLSKRRRKLPGGICVFQFGDQAERAVGESLNDADSIINCRNGESAGDAGAPSRTCLARLDSLAGRLGIDRNWKFCAADVDGNERKSKPETARASCNLSAGLYKLS